MSALLRLWLALSLAVLAGCSCNARSDDDDDDSADDDDADAGDDDDGDDDDDVPSMDCIELEDGSATPRFCCPTSGEEATEAELFACCDDPGAHAEDCCCGEIREGGELPELPPPLADDPPDPREYAGPMDCPDDGTGAGSTAVACADLPLTLSMGGDLAIIPPDPTTGEPAPDFHDMGPGVWGYPELHVPAVPTTHGAVFAIVGPGYETEYLAYNAAEIPVEVPDAPMALVEMRPVGIVSQPGTPLRTLVFKEAETVDGEELPNRYEEHRFPEHSVVIWYESPDDPATYRVHEIRRRFEAIRFRYEEGSRRIVSVVSNARGPLKTFAYVDGRLDAIRTPNGRRRVEWGVDHVRRVFPPNATVGGVFYDQSTRGVVRIGSDAADGAVELHLGPNREVRRRENATTGDRDELATSASGLTTTLSDRDGSALVRELQVGTFCTANTPSGMDSCRPWRRAAGADTSTHFTRRYGRHAMNELTVTLGPGDERAVMRCEPDCLLSRGTTRITRMAIIDGVVPEESVVMDGRARQLELEHFARPPERYEYVEAGDPDNAAWSVGMLAKVFIADELRYEYRYTNALDPSTSAMRYVTELIDTKDPRSGGKITMTTHGLVVRDEPNDGVSVQYVWEYVDLFGDPSITERTPRLTTIIGPNGRIVLSDYQGTVPRRQESFGRAFTPPSGTATTPLLSSQSMQLTTDYLVESMRDDVLDVELEITGRDSTSTTPTSWVVRAAGMTTSQGTSGPLDRRNVWPQLRAPETTRSARDVTTLELTDLPPQLVTEEPNWSSP